MQYLPIGAVVGIILLAELILVFATGAIDIHVPRTVTATMPNPEEISNTRALGNILYTQYAYLFQSAGFILLIAMVGAIVLTHRSRQGVRRQKIAAQIARDPKSAVILKQIKSGEEGSWKSD